MKRRLHFIIFFILTLTSSFLLSVLSSCKNGEESDELLSFLTIDKNSKNGTRNHYQEYLDRMGITTGSDSTATGGYGSGFTGGSKTPPVISGSKTPPTITGVVGGFTGTGAVSGSASSGSGSSVSALDAIFQASYPSRSFGDSLMGTTWTTTPTDQLKTQWEKDSSIISIMAFVSDHEVWIYNPSALSGNAGTQPSFSDQPFSEAKLREALAKFPKTITRQYYELDKTNKFLLVFHNPPESHASDKMPERVLEFRDNKADPRFVLFGMYYYPTPKGKSNLGN